jgi:hypothetical protein
LQVCGINILFILVCLISPTPLSGYIGLEACNWADFLGCFYISGVVTWGSLIAMYRLALIKAPNLIKTSLGESKLVLVMIAGGLTTSVATCLVLAYVDKGVGFSYCSHLSLLDIQVVEVKFLPIVL